MPSNALASLLGGIVDYAGLFPPAALDMATTVENYARYRQHPHAWMLGRLVVPVGRLDEWEEAVAGRLPDRGPGWLLSVLAGADPPAEDGRLRRFQREHGPEGPGGRATVERLEIRVASHDAIESVARLWGDRFELYFELPVGEAGRPWIEAAARAGVRGKLRTGGITEDLLPSPEDLARSLALFAEAGVAFKATAGLHHPLRGAHPLSYEPGAPVGTMHGFLNVFLAGALLRAGRIDERAAARLLAAQDPAAFRWGEEHVEWEGQRLQAAELAAMREGFAHSFGSCSFDEPIEDLNEVDLL